MIQSVIFDTDGMVNHREMYFSKYYSEKFGLEYGKMLSFFEGDFQQCLIGKLDLKEELEKRLELWEWKGSVDELLKMWFEYESNLDEKVLEHVDGLRKKGIKCYLSTNNEKYRADYLMNTLGLKNHFDGVFSSAEVGQSKEWKEFWEFVYKKIGESGKESVLVWDDDKTNLAPAKEFGFKTEFYSGFEDYKKKMEELI